MNQATFDLGSTEIMVPGRVDAKVQLYDADDRISTLYFAYSVVKDPSGDDYIPSENEKTLIEDVIGNGRQIIADAKAATINANDAANNANTAAIDAYDASDSANTATNNANVATGKADTATGNANAAADNANSVATDVRNAQVAIDASELVRKNNESARVTAESGRVTAESTRVTNENSRVTVEGARVTAETTRGTNETARKNAETARVTAEGLRVTAETARATAETARVNTEALRVTAETARAGAETLRASAESSRVTVEAARVSKETTRESNETTRQTQETARQTNTQTAITNADNATSTLNTLIGNTKGVGTYNPSTTYKPNNFVQYNGSTYMCIAQALNKVPTDVAFWQLVASRGQDGAGTVAGVVSTNADLSVGGTAQTPDLAINPTLKNAWNDKYTKSEMDVISVGKEDISNKGIRNGYAGLDANGKVPAEQLNVVNVNKAKVMNLDISSTAEGTYGTYTPQIKGNFLVGVYLRVITGPTIITVRVTYGDDTGPQSTIVLDAKLTPVGSYSLLPLFINSIGGAVIAVKAIVNVATQVKISTSITEV